MDSSRQIVQVRDVMLQHVPVAAASSTSPQPLLLPREITARYRDWSERGSRGLDAAQRYFTAFDDRLGGRPVFIKVCPRGSDDDRTRHAQHIANLLNHLKHPRISPLHESITTSKYILQVAPLMTGGSLWDQFYRRETLHGDATALSATTTAALSAPMTEADVISIVRSVLQGLVSLHEEGIRYGTLHPSKLVYTNAADGVASLKLSSFRGSHSVLNPIAAGSTPRPSHNQSVLPRSAEDMMRQGLHYGSIPLLSPEEVHVVFGGADSVFTYRHTGAMETRNLADCEVGAPSDMWGVGVLAHLLLTGHFPYNVWGRGESPFHVLQNIAQKDFDPNEARRSTEPFVWPPKHLTQEAIASCTASSERMFREVQLARGSMYAPALNFISLCLQREPQSRMSSSQALLHPWLTTVSPLESPSERVLPQEARSLSASPAATVAWAQPSYLGRFKNWLRDYVALCHSAHVRPSSFALSMLCQPGHWRTRSAIEVDLSGGGCGPLGCCMIIQSLLVTLSADRSRFNAASDCVSPPPMMRLARLTLRRCDLHDAAVSFIVQLLIDHWALTAGTLGSIDLRDNVLLTHDSGRSLLRLVASWERRCMRQANDNNAPLAAPLTILLDGTSIGPHLVDRLKRCGVLLSPPTDR